MCLKYAVKCCYFFGDSSASRKGCIISCQASPEFSHRPVIRSIMILVSRDSSCILSTNTSHRLRSFCKAIQTAYKAVIEQPIMSPQNPISVSCWMVKSATSASISYPLNSYPHIFIPYMVQDVNLLEAQGLYRTSCVQVYMYGCLHCFLRRGPH